MTDSAKIRWDRDRCRGTESCGLRCLKEASPVEPCRFCTSPPPRRRKTWDRDAPTVTLTINGTETRAFRGENLLDCLRAAGCAIPTLCHHPALAPLSACRLCIVEVTRDGNKTVTTSCDYTIDGPIAVETDTPRLSRNRRVLIELLLAEAPASREIGRAAAACGVPTPDVSREADDRKACIGCGRCIAVSETVVGCRALSMSGKSSGIHAAFPFEATENPACHRCGACAAVCPTGALSVPIAADGAPSCDLCVWICPDGAISKTDGLIEIDDNRCKSCGLCIHYCPDKALHLSSTYDR